jgi:hypothetical protein
MPDWIRNFIERCSAVLDILAKCDRVLWTRRIVALGCLLSLLLSSRLWLDSGRFFPTAPLIPSLPPLPFPLDCVVFVLTCASLIVILCNRLPFACTITFLVLASILALWDQNRWQPWFYEYCLLLGALALIGKPSNRDETALNTCRLIVASVYIWSGLHKLNASYATDAFLWLMGPFLSASPAWVTCGLAVLSALFETAMGFALLSLRGRHFALFALAAMHIFILARIGPFGANWNSVVWPWNLTMVALLVLLFYGTQNSRALDIVDGNHWFHKLVLSLCLALPFLHVVDKWDGYASFALYSGDENQVAFLFNSRTWGSVPEEIRRYGRRKQNGYYLLEGLTWSLGELNAPNNCEVRIFKQIGRKLAPLTDGPHQIIMLIEKRPLLWQSKGELLNYDVRDL